MTIITKRIALATIVGLIAVGVTAGIRASAQNMNPDTRPFSGPRTGQRGPRGRVGPGGPIGLGPGGPLGMLRMLGARLGLTEAQQGQIKTIVESHRDEWNALGDRARAAHDALRDAVTADTVDEALIRAKSADAAAVEADIAVASARARAEAWQVLTPEQQAQAKQLQSEAGARMRDRVGVLRHWLGWDAKNGK
jgi:Spy/CpxP family protein refolding chaperone